jgi:hypothetical protein
MTEKEVHPKTSEFSRENVYPQHEPQLNSHAHSRLRFRDITMFTLMPILHLVCCILLVLCMVYLLEGYLAALPSQPRYVDGHLKMRVSDITTLISVALTLIKLLVGAWTGTILWNCIFTLLETSGLNLNQINRILSFYTPPFRRDASILFVALLLLLVVPQQFISPLLSGAVGWGDGFEFGQHMAQVEGGSTAASPLMWYWYWYSTANRRTYVRRAAGYAAIAWSNSTTDRGHCRHIMDDDGMAINSSVLSVVMPCIQIQSITFPQTPPPASLVNLTSDDIFNSNDSLSRDADPLLAYFIDGNLILFDPNDLPVYGDFPQRSNTSFEMDVPSPYLHSGTMIAIVMINGTVPLDGKNCTNLRENIFGLTTYNNIFSPVQSGNYYRCLTYAVVNFTAGVIVSPSSTYISSRVIESDQPASEMEIIAAPWVHEALYLMPDVMSTFSMMNSTPLATWENLENYTAQLIRYSYQAAWDMLSRSFEPNTTIIPARVYEQRQKAIVSHTRVYAWLAISLLSPCSCIILFVFKPRISARQAIKDGPIAAVRTDSSLVLDQKGCDLTDLLMLNSEVNKRVSTLNLRRNGDGDFTLTPKSQDH